VDGDANMQRRIKTVSFRLSSAERAILDEILFHYDVKGSNLSEKFRALLHAIDRDLDPLS
jgi:hypothetical protein